jgi:hypothetical protein
MATSTEKPSHAALPPTTARGLRPGSEAADIVFSCLDHGEAPQIGVLGDTGAGKTTAMRALVAEYLKRSPGIVLAVDDKERAARYTGVERKSRADLAARPITSDERERFGRVIVFRGDMLAAVDADPEEVAAFAWDLARLGKPTLVVHDELNREKVVKNMAWRKGVTWIPNSFAKGRAVGVGDLWGSQSPQDAPIAVFEQSSAILCFKLAGMGLEKLRHRGYLDGGAEKVIPTLHAMDAPPAQRGDFVLLQRGQPWNGAVYKFGA